MDQQVWVPAWTAEEKMAMGRDHDLPVVAVL